MKNVSNAFKEQMKNRTDFFATAEITLTDGTVIDLTKSDFNIQGNTIVQGGSANSFPLGIVSSRQITVSLLNDNDRWGNYGFYGAKIKLVTNFQTNEPDGDPDFTPVTEHIQEGTFTVISPESYGTSIEITAMDETYKLDVEYSSAIQFPARVDEALRDACGTCGITLYSADFLNNDYIIKEKPDNITFRDFVGFCAMIAGGNAVMDYQNRLKIISYDFSPFEDEAKAGEIPILTSFAMGMRFDASDVVVTGLQITGEVTSTDADGNEITQTQVFMEGESGYVLQLENDLTKNNEEDFLHRLGDIVIGSRFRGFSGEHVSNPLLEFMDLVYIKDFRGNSYQTFLTNVDFSYFGMTSLKCSVESPIRTGQSSGKDTVKQIKQLIEDERTERQKAIDRLNNMLKSGNGMYVTEEQQEDGSVIMYIHDKPTIAESKNVVKITGDAVGISNDGGETYIYGLTYDGEAILRKIYAEGIDADYITTGHLSADMILGGTLELGGWNNQNGVLKIIDENGEIIGTWDKNGITILKGKLSADLIEGGILTLGGLNNQHGVLYILNENKELIGKWDNEGITATIGSFAGNITVGGVTNGVCKVLDEEGAENLRLDTKGLSAFGSEGNLLISLDWTGLWIYNDKSETKQKVGQIGLTFRDSDTSKPGVILGLDPDGEVIGFGAADSVSGKYSTVFAYARTEDALASGKDLNMNGHTIYNAVIDGMGNGGESGGVGEFTNEAKNSEIFNDYEKNYINPQTAYAHVSGSTNYIDRDENISNNFSQMAAILGGVNNQIKQANLSVIIGGTGNNIVRGIISCIAAGVSNMCESQLSFIGGGNGNKILNLSANSSVICGGSSNKIENTSNSGIVAGSQNAIKGSMSYQSAIIGGYSNTIEEGYYNAIIGGSGNKISHNSYGCIFSGINNKTVAAISSSSVSSNCFVCGYNNQLKGACDCIVCGAYGIAEYNHRLVIGNGRFEDPYNVFYVDHAGNVYAKSFNIIGETASEASTFSAKSADNPDLSELTAQISEIKAEIEALIAENQTLRAEIESLKANL